MCDPVSAGITIATTLASSYLQNKASNAVKDKRSQVTANAERDLRKYRDTAAGSFQKSLASAGADTLTAENAKAGAARDEDYQAALGTEDLLPTQTRGSEAAKTAIIKALGQGAANSQQLATKRALLDAYGDTTLGRDIDMHRNAGAISQQGNFAQGRSGVAQLELEAANSAGKKYADLAGIVNAIGTVGGAAYGAGAGAGMWGGYDPSTGITRNSGRQVLPKTAAGQTVGTFRV